MVMCFGLPLLFMALRKYSTVVWYKGFINLFNLFKDFIVQGHRFDIIEGYGCRPTSYFSVPSIFIVYIPPILMSTVAMIFAGLALRYFMFRRLSFAAQLSSSNSALTTSHYLRLMAMASFQMVWSITATSYSLWFTVKAVPIRPWTNWNDVHSDWLRVDVFPDAFTPLLIKKAFYFIWWIMPISTFLFVVFFSFGKDAMNEYAKCFKWIQTKIFRHDLSKPSVKKDRNFSVLTSKSGSLHGPISKPTLCLNSDSVLPTPRYEVSSATSTFKSMELGLWDIDSECHSQYASPLPCISGAKAVGSYTDLTIQTPSTVVDISPMNCSRTQDPVQEKPLPLTPAPNSQLRPLFLPNSSSPTSRPLTYPSFEAAQRSVMVLQPKNDQ